MREQFEQYAEADERLLRDFEKLKVAAELLREMRFRVIDSSISREMLKKETEQENSFPLVHDGAQGIRVNCSKRRGITIWFTNGFENPTNPRRQEVEKKLKEAGL